MNSKTGEFFSARKEIDNVKLFNTRNALSAVTRKYRPRKILNIKPLSLTDLQKELEEADKERLHVQSTAVIEEEETTNKENVTKPKDNVTKPETQTSQSFELDFSALSLTTPAKPKETVQDGDFATPKPSYRPIIAKSNRIQEHQYATPKIQCTVNMQTYLKTPLDKLCSVQKTAPKKEREQDCDSRNSNLARPLFVDNFKKICVNNVEYIVLNELGKGGSSEVFQCYNVESKTHRAIKCVSLQNPASATGFINEVKVLQRLQKCNRIIKMFDYEINETTKTLLVVLEVGGMDLSKILKESALSTSHMPMYMLLYYWMEMLYAVRQIHTHGIIHSDLKPANFLKAEGCLKLIDFGIASCIQNDMTSVIKVVPEGSFNYISPEALNNESSSNTGSPSFGKPKYKISFKSDVWSLGCILYQLVYRRTPFQHITQMWTKLSKILDPNHEISYPEADWVPQKIIDTIKRCLQYNMKHRPSIDDLIIEYETLFKNI